MSHCHTCKFATWNKTPTGRISKSLPGKCAWSKTVQLPSCGYEQGKPLVLRGGAIWHRDAVKCATYEKAKS
jgi:hypothetical protein